MTTIAVPTLRPLMLQRTAGLAAEPAATADHNDIARSDPADFVVLRQVLETVGYFAPAPPNPPWADPRPDLTADHDRWQALLEAAYRHDGQDPHGVYGALSGIRCCGAQLEVGIAAGKAPQAAGMRTGWRLVRGDELTEAEYQRLRATYLVPHTEALTQLLNAPSLGGARQPG
jgi:hypothetical protein